MLQLKLEQDGGLARKNHPQKILIASQPVVPRPRVDFANCHNNAIAIGGTTLGGFGCERLSISPSQPPKEFPMYKFLIAGGVALLATTAMAQNAPDFDNNQRLVFMDDSGAMRPEADAQNRFMALPAEQQTAIRTRCDEFRNVAPQGSSDLTDTSQNQMPNPAPGAIMQSSCTYVQNF